MITEKQWQAMHAEIESLKKRLEDSYKTAVMVEDECKELKQQLAELKASLPKVRAGALRKYVKVRDSVFYSAYKPTLEEFADKLEAGNE